MARINVEDSLWSNPRFMRLIAKMGDEARALGSVVLAFRLAQVHWCPEKRPIPKDVWEASEFPPELIACGLVEVRDGGYYVKGSEIQFAWWFQRQEAGKKGGKAKAANASGRKAGASGRLAKPSKLKQTVASLSTSFSPSPSVSESGSSSEKKLYSVGDEGGSSAGVVKPPLDLESIRSPIGFFIANYVNAYQVRYGAAARPALSGAVQGQIKRFLAEHTLERACNLIQVYCQMSDAWFITKAHDFGTFIANLSKVGLALDTGRFTTRSEAIGEEKKQGILNVWGPLIAEAEVKDGKR